MNVVTLGSKYLDDIIVNSSYFQNKRRIVGISPLSTPGERILLDSFSDDYYEYMNQIELTNSLFDIIDSTTFDIFIFDFLSILNDLVCVRGVDGSDCMITNILHKRSLVPNFLEKLGFCYCGQTSYKDISQDIFENRIHTYISNILSHFGEKEIIMFSIRLPYFSWNEEKGEYICFDYDEISLINNLFEKIDTIAKLLGVRKIIRIDCMRLLSCPTYYSHSLAFPEKYLKMLGEMIYKLVGEQEVDSIYTDMSLYSAEYNNDCYIKCFKEDIEKFAKNRSIIYVMNDEIALKYENKKSHMDISDFIYYLSHYYETGKQCFVILPSITYSNNFCERIRETINSLVDFFIPNLNIIIQMRNFCGEYFDCFGNYVKSDSAVSLEMNGIGNSVIVNRLRSPSKIQIKILGLFSSIDIDSFCNFDKTSIYMNSFSSIGIGEKSSFAEKCHFEALDLSKISIGKDAMFSSFVSCVSSKDVFLGDHTWIGYQAIVKSNASVKTGSIIGARSHICDSYPNNVIVVGNPGKIIRKDIYWEREPFTSEIVQPQYAHFTEQIPD